MQVETTAADWERVANADGKTIVANAGLLETLFLKPLFHAFQHEVSKRIEGKMGNIPLMNYGDAKVLGGRGFRFKIADYNIQSDIYINDMEVAFANTATATQINIHGRLFLYKGRQKDMGMCPARWSAQSDVNWDAVIAIAQAPTDNKSGDLRLSHSTLISKNESHTHQNDCAQAFEFGGSRESLVFVTKVVDEKFFSDLFTSLVNNAANAIAGLAGSIPTDILREKGEPVTFITNPRIDDRGRFTVEVM
jgi:hypothetical protein